MAERLGAKKMMDDIFRYTTFAERALLPLEEFFDEVETRKELYPLRHSVKECKRMTSEVLNEMIYGPTPLPYTSAGKQFAKKVNDLMTYLKSTTAELAGYRKKRGGIWDDELNKKIDRMLTYKLDTVNGKTLPEVVDAEIDLANEMYKLPVLYASKPGPKKRRGMEAKEAVTTPGEKTFAMMVILAFGFTMISGLNNLSRAAAGGGLQSLDTGFYLLPGGPFITSLQMVLFMLSSVVVIVYLFGKSFGEW